MARYTITNTAAGPRGVHQDDGSYVELAPGQTVTADLTDAEHKSAAGTGHFTFGGKANTAGLDRDASGDAGGSLPRNVAQLKKIARDERIEIGTAKSADDLQAVIVAGRKAKGAAPPATPADDLATLDDPTLKATVAAITGKPVADLPDDRDALLELARGTGE